jgi:alkanesulfonate monooxygenase SsuD/methylene tetrahydromethanopterin reductase-like flavin-dependent oxidoreductase (luciferase family)
MLEAVVLSGEESQVAERLQGLFALGATEVLVSPVAAGGDREASITRTLQLVADVAKTTTR